MLNEPVFEDEKNLDEEKFKIEFQRLEALLEAHGININFTRERDNRFKYNFITREFFDHETTLAPIKGMITHFNYEEFHPDHELEITELTNHFLNDFFERKLAKETYYINDELIEPDGNILSKEELINRFQSLYEVAPEFENTSYTLDAVEFELKEFEDQHSGMGFSEGSISYDIIFRDGERKLVRNGPFKIYFTREWDCWGICFFYLAGFNLHSKKQED